MQISFHDFSSGFPQHWITSPYEQELAYKIFKNFFGRLDDGLLVNCTWGGNSVIPGRHDSKFSQVIETLQEYPIRHALFFNFVDDFDSEWIPIINKAKDTLGSNRVKLVGNPVHDNDLQFQFWPLAVNKFFAEYAESNLELTSLDNYFLCYNRKPHGHRVELYESLKDNNLVDDGIFTLGDENHRSSITVGANAASGNTHAFQVDPHASYAIPNDLMSFGNMGIWQRSFLNIVTETQYPGENGFPFLTEKTFKPIIGKRPFLVLGPQSTTDWLKNNGFYVFNSDFGLPDTDPDIDDIVHVIKTKPVTELTPSIRKKIRHNELRFPQFCKETKKYIGV